MNHSLESIVNDFGSSARSRLGLELRDSQIQAARSLQEPVVVEMATGEGKTLTIALAACIAASSNARICIATANTYLAQRDASWMKPIYDDLGLTVDSVGKERCQYDSNIVYGTIRAFAFDHLRCRIAGRRGIAAHSGPDTSILIVDEADSVMIDEAITPLVISESQPLVSPADEACYRWAASIAGNFLVETDFIQVDSNGQVALTSCGHHKVLHTEMPVEMNSLDMTRIIHALERALWVNQVMHAGQQYIVRDGRVTLVQEYTGRTSEQQSFSAGIHQAVEAREKLKITPETTPIAKITVQDFVDQYRHVCGLTATASDDEQEFHQVYGLKVISIERNVPSRLKILSPIACADEASKWQLIADETIAMIKQERPVLIGTRSISQSESLSQTLSERGIDHDILNARFPEREASVIASAGQAGQVTVATNMAGRGTDIPLSKKSRRAGGLHVIVSETHAAKRIDRQLMGRAARRGDPGSARRYVCPDDQVLRLGLTPKHYKRLRASIASESHCSMLLNMVDKAQRQMSKHDRIQRSRLTAMHAELAASLAQLGLDPFLDPLPE